jgi:hypothetical protein
MKLKEHVAVITAECDKISEENHTISNAALWSGLQDVRISALRLLEIEKQTLDKTSAK